MKRLLALGLVLALTACLPHAHADPPKAQADAVFLKTADAPTAVLPATLATAEIFFAVERTVEGADDKQLAPVQSCASEQRKGGRESGTANQRLTRLA